MRRVAAGAGLGWAGIVGLGWVLADRRIALCGRWTDASDVACRLRATAARDTVLTHGLTVALIAAAALALIAGGARKLSTGRRQPMGDPLEAGTGSLNEAKAGGLAWAILNPGSVGVQRSGGGFRGVAARPRRIAAATMGALAAVGLAAILHSAVHQWTSHGQANRPVVLTPIEGDPFAKASSADGAIVGER